MVFEDLKKSFQNRHRDFSFDSALLDKLNDEERKIVERMIIEYCLDGDSSCFKHIEHLKFYRPEEVFTAEKMRPLDNSLKVRLLKILFDRTKDSQYVDALLQLSYQDVGAYSMLTLMYCDGEISPVYYDRIKGVCDVVTDNKETYIKMSQRMKSIPRLDDDSKQIHPRFLDDAGINHDKALYDMVTGKNGPINGGEQGQNFLK